MKKGGTYIAYISLLDALKFFFFILYDQVITSLLLYMMYIKPKSHRDFLVVL